MKRLILILLLTIVTTSGAVAQTGLRISRVFGGRYADDAGVTETMMSGTSKFLKSHKLEVLASFRGPSETYAPIISPLVLADGKRAKGRNVKYRDGQLYFAFFELAPTSSGNKRYIYYLNNNSSKPAMVTLLYFEGKLTSADASSLIQSTVKKSKR